MKNEPILKPMSVARQEFITSLTNLINGCMLPPFVIEDVLKDVCNKINILSKQQLENDMRKYKESLNEASDAAQK